MKITADVLRKHGYTESCEGCKFKETGVTTGGRTHIERSRKRIMEAISQEEQGFDKVRKDQERMEWRVKGKQQEEAEPDGGLCEDNQEEDPMEVEEESKVQMLFKVIARIEEQQLRELIKSNSPDLAELYIPPRVVKEAAKYNRMAGASIDLTN